MKFQVVSDYVPTGDQPQAIEKLAPKIVVMENVRGMLPYAEQVVEDYQNITIKKGANNYTYKIAYKVLVSDDFGVAQKRQRLIFIAVRNDIVKKHNKNNVVFS